MTTAIVSSLFGGVKEVDIDSGEEWSTTWRWKHVGIEEDRNIKHLDPRRLMVTHYRNMEDFYGQKHPCPANWEVAL